VTIERRRGLPHEPVMDYRHAPHLAQWPLYDRLVQLVTDTVRALPGPSPARVLELGASHGGYTELLLALGCEVTVAEMSPPAVARVRTRYGGHPRLTIAHGLEASLAGVAGGYSLALSVSVLHHVPDYLGALERVAGRVQPGGSLVTVQDPLWYPRAGRMTHAIDRSAYLAWRVAQGRFAAGAAAMVRRLRGVYPEARGDEVVYHHVVRRGVDEEAVAALLARSFERVELVAYWSHHLAALRRPAEAAGLVNTFAVRATGRAG
jgi:SAM-dependent methyltransferase